MCVCHLNASSRRSSSRLLSSDQCTLACSLYLPLSYSLSRKSNTMSLLCSGFNTTCPRSPVFTLQHFHLQPQQRVREPARSENPLLLKDLCQSPTHSMFVCLSFQTQDQTLKWVLYL